MGQLLLHRPRGFVSGHPARWRHPHSALDPAAPARGILLALALSSLFWIGLALLVPLFW